MAVSKRSSSIQPDPNQQQAIAHVLGPMLVVAGAGTGKTTVLTRRIAHLIHEGHAKADQILALTYTDNAAREMLERVRRELGRGEAEGLQVSTFHAYCNNLLIHSKQQFRVLDDKQLWIFLRRNIRELQLNYFVRAANVSKFLDDLLEFIRRCHDELVTPRQYADYVRRIGCGEVALPRVSKSKEADELSPEEALGRCREIASVFETVERMLQERNLGTFGHMIVRANELLESDAAMLERERSRARFILIDEFQDANFAQIKVLEKLAGSLTNAGEAAGATPPGAQQNIFVVGDPDQGIYRFRGASSDAFELFTQSFPATKLVILTKNRRSTTPILRSAYDLISKNPEFSFPHGAHYRRMPLVSARDEQENANASQRALVNAVLVTSPFMEATDLVSTLVELRRRTRCAWKDIAVLYRIHHHREEVVNELARNNVPFAIEALDVMDTPEVRDLLACVGAVVSPANSGALFRAAALQQFAIDAEGLRAAIKTLPRDSDASIAAVLPSVPGGSNLLKTIDDARQEVAGKKTHAALLALSRIFQIARTPPIQALLEFAANWEGAPLTETGSPGEFLEYLDYFREARGSICLAANEQEDSVKLMSVHGAKGLEFDHVFILRAVSNSFPASYREPLIEFPAELRNSGLRGGADDKALYEQEERRLFYVGMTRARDTLTLYGPFGRGSKEKTPPGYLRELIKNRELQAWFKHRDCREFQTEIFAAAEPLPLGSRLSEWVALPPAGDLSATLSASAIDRYQLCPLQFKLEREWRIPAEVSAAMQYGASMHRVLLTFYDSVRWNRAKTDEELVQQFREDLAGEGIADAYQHDLYEQQGIAQLREFLASARRAQPDVLHTEERFTVKLASTTLVGRIDRIDRGRSGGVIIIDYKTGRPKSQEDADESLQLTLYAMAAREKWGYDVERLIFHNLDGNVAVTTGRSRIELEEAKLKVEDIAAKIAAGKFDAKPGIHCNFCAYRFLCPKTEKRMPQIAPAMASGSAAQ
ncbi:MAG TPA: ATP-dependent DNA helicase [Terriglobales bacterium]